MAQTLAQLFRQTVANGRADMILAKTDGEYRPISAQEIYRRVGRLHLDFRRVGISKGDRCALLSDNRWEWAVADFAMMTAGVVSVPLYPTLTGEQMHYMLEHSEARVVLLSNQIQYDKITAIWDSLPRLQGIVAFDPIATIDERVIQLQSLIGNEPLNDAEKREFEVAATSVQPSDTASIIYTSGTTGVPKGVILTHGNFVSNINDIDFEVGSKDVCLSFLPLCHVAERTADYTYFFQGAAVAYAESIEAVPDNMREVRPTMAFGVPRFFEKIHDKVIAAMDAAPAVRRKLFYWALGVGKRAAARRLEGRGVPTLLALQASLADALVFRKLRKRLGGRFRLFISGAAPLARHLAEFFFGVGLPNLRSLRPHRDLARRLHQQAWTGPPRHRR